MNNKSENLSYVNILLSKNFENRTFKSYAKGWNESLRNFSIFTSEWEKENNKSLEKMLEMVCH